MVIGFTFTVNLLLMTPIVAIPLPTHTIRLLIKTDDTGDEHELNRQHKTDGAAELCLHYSLLSS